MKKHVRYLLLSVVLFAFGLGINFKVFAASPSPDDIITDNNCVHYLLTHGGSECNRQCKRDCVEDNHPCDFGDPEACNTAVVWGTDGELETATNLIINPEDFSDSFVIMGIDLGPTEQAIPRLIRIFFFGAFAAIGAAALGYGVYAMVVISTALDNAEKFETGMKILKNVILGVVISFGGLIVVQIVSLLTGLQQNIFNFYFIPKQGQDIKITKEFFDDGPCLPNQNATVIGTGQVATCGTDGKWQ